MSTPESGSEVGPPSSLVSSFKAYLGTWVDLFRTRLDLASTELEEQQERFQQLLLLGAAALVCFSFGILLVTLFILALFWDTNYRLAVLGALAVLYLAAGAIIGAMTRRKSRNKPKLLSASLDELRKDFQQLSS